MAVLAAVLPAVLHAQAAPDRQRVMYVTVTDRNDRPVTGLTPDDFVIREDGARREVLQVGPATAPVEITLLVDTSEDSSPATADIRRALTEFFKAVKGNEIGITTFGGRPQVMQNYTASLPVLDKAVGRLFAEQGSGAYLLEALSSIARGVATRAPERALILAIVIRSAPEFSDVPHEVVVEALDRCGATFDAIVVETGRVAAAPTRGRSTAIRDRDAVLDEGTRTTGGVYRQALSSMMVSAAMTSIAAQLRDQYRVVYARPESLIPPQRIDVAVTKAGLTARGTPVRAQR